MHPKQNPDLSLSTESVGQPAQKNVQQTSYSSCKELETTIHV